jgi:2-amino-4-hydroxy-6-hydroxymethyldihydropteridine diphosphokinase
MTSAVLSVGSNMGDRLAHLQSVVDGLGKAVCALSPVYETDPWGGVDQDSFLNAVLVAEDRELDGHGWLRRGQELERAADRVREKHWGPRTLDVDVISCRDGAVEVVSHDDELTLPHPYAHQRAFVLIPWLAVDPAATVMVGGEPRSIASLLAELGPSERDAVRLTDLTLVL